LAADVRKDLVQTIHRQMTAPAIVLGQIEAAVGRLSSQGSAWLESLHLDLLEQRQECTAEMRYVGQSFEMAVVIDRDALADLTGARLRDRFHAMYRSVYGYADEVAELEVLDVRVSVVGVTPKPRLAKLPPKPPSGSSGDPPSRTRTIFFGGAPCNALVYQRDELPVGFRFAGPAIIEQYDTTTFVTPGFTVTVDEFGNLVGEADHGE
jgi:N-methylhydantoinase A